MKKVLKTFRKSNSGSAAIEYALIIGLVSILIVLAFSEGSFKENFDGLITAISDKFSKSADAISGE